MAELHVERSGSGPPLVFWHGWGLNLRVFDALRGALGHAWRTHAVDLPGHGASRWITPPHAAHDARDARDAHGMRTDTATATATATATEDAALAALIDTLPPASTLVGWSLGGQFALRAALAAPDRVARLVLVGTTPRFVAAPYWPQGVPAEALSGMQQRLAADWHRTVGEFLELQVRGSRDAASTLVGLRAALAAHGEAKPEALAEGLAWLARHDLRARLAQVLQPALVIAGQHDRVTPPAASAALAAALPHARHVAIARAAHAPFLSHPQEFLATVRDFLADGTAA